MSKKGDKFGHSLATHIHFYLNKTKIKRIILYIQILLSFEFADLWIFGLENRYRWHNDDAILMKSLFLPVLTYRLLLYCNLGLWCISRFQSDG